MKMEDALSLEVRKQLAFLSYGEFDLSNPPWTVTSLVVERNCVESALQCAVNQQEFPDVINTQMRYPQRLDQWVMESVLKQPAPLYRHGLTEDAG